MSDAIDPGRKFEFRVEAVEVLIGFNEGVLGGVLSEMGSRRRVVV